MKPLNFLLLLFLFPSLIVAQHTINTTFSPAEDYSWAILYKTSPTRNQYVAQGKIENGKIEFKLDSAATSGIYKLTYALPQEEYNFDIIYNEKEDIVLTFNKDEGLIFKESSENILLNEYMGNMSIINTKIGNFYVNQKENKDSLVGLFNQQRELQSQFEKKSEGTLASHFIKANKPYIPTKYEDANTYITNLASNYFSFIDFSDPFLQSSRFLMDRSIGYIVGVIPENIDKTTAFNNNIDFIEQQLSGTEKNYHKIFLDRLWQKLVNYRLTDNANYLATTYLIPLAQKHGDQKLVTKLINFKNLSIGNKAPDFSWIIEENGNKKSQKLSDLSVAENYILIFWGSTCSHCLEEMPKLYTLINTFNSLKYKVIAIGLEDQQGSWDDEIKKYPNFIHVLGAGKWENEIGKAYNVKGTPTYFVLDKDKKFILKPNSLEELEMFIKQNNK